MQKMHSVPAAPAPSLGVGSAVSRVYDSIEGVLDALGLMRGTFAPFKRFVFAGGIAMIIVMAYKPDYAFNRGAIRPHKLLQGENPVPGTWMPFWAPGLIAGFAAALFI